MADGRQFQISFIMTHGNETTTTKASSIKEMIVA